MHIPRSNPPEDGDGDRDSDGAGGEMRGVMRVEKKRKSDSR